MFSNASVCSQVGYHQMHPGIGHMVGYSLPLDNLSPPPTWDLPLPPDNRPGTYPWYWHLVAETGNLFLITCWLKDPQGAASVGGTHHTWSLSCLCMRQREEQCNDAVVCLIFKVPIWCKLGVSFSSLHADSYHPIEKKEAGARYSISSKKPAYRKRKI